MRDTNTQSAYIASLSAPEDDLLRRVRASASGPSAGMMVSASEGALLHWLARLIRPIRIVEIGSLVGYSACWLARALEPGGTMHALEADPRHAKVLRNNLASLPQVRIHEGRALDTLPALGAEGPFDFVFIDADKENYSAYLEWAGQNLRVGGMVAVDNSLRFGDVDVSGPAPDSAPARRAWESVRRTNTQLSKQDMWLSTFIPTAVGLAVAIKNN